MSPIAPIVDCSAASLAGPDGRLLCLQGEPVAALNDPGSVAALVARVGGAAPLPDMLGALVAPRPSGVLVVASGDASFSMAVALRDGRVASVVGPEPLQNMGTWVIEFHRRAAEARGAQFPGDDAAMMRALEPGRTFVVETVLDGLRRCDHAGASILLLSGDNHWLHEALPSSRTPDFSFLLMEHARRGDELPGLERSLGSADGPIVAVTRPAAKPAVRPVQTAGSEWDFFDDPDPAAEAEWLDARFVFDYCDGSSGLEGIVERTMLGRFRTVSALLALTQRRHVQLIADEYADLICDLAS